MQLIEYRPTLEPGEMPKCTSPEPIAVRALPACRMAILSDHPSVAPRNSCKAFVASGRQLLKKLPPHSSSTHKAPACRFPPPGADPGKGSAG